jgi:Uma2 family endonuclease
LASPPFLASPSGDGSFEVVAAGESAFDERRPSLIAWLAAHPLVLNFDDCHSEGSRHRQPKPRKTPMRNRATLSPMNLTAHKPMTLAEFLPWEERQELRYEFDGLEPVAMTGGAAGHAIVQRNLAIALGGRLRGQPCQFYGSDLKIKVAEDHIRYPDGMVVCSPVDRSAKVVHDPVVIFEVLSPGTAAKDRIVKAREYQATPSVHRYVMLEQERVGATVLLRVQDGWRAVILKDDDSLEMPEIGLAVPLAEFYEGLTFEDHPVEDNDNDQTPPAA